MSMMLTRVVAQSASKVDKIRKFLVKSQPLAIKLSYSCCDYSESIKQGDKECDP